MRYGTPMAEPTAPMDESDPCRDSAAAALVAVFDVSPLAQAVFDESGRCTAASPGFTGAAAAAADNAGRLNPAFLAGADVRDVAFGGSTFRLVTLPLPVAPAAATADVPALERVLRALLNAIPAAISAKDRDLRYLFMNKHQADLWGIDPAAA